MPSILNNNLYSMLAMIIAVFLTGMYLRGESARKAEIREEMDLIQQQQDAIMATVASIREMTHKKDSMLVEQVELASNYILALNREGNMTAAELEARGAEISRLNTNLDSLMASSIQVSGFRFEQSRTDSLITSDNP